jgi:hypothetical protein
MWKCLRILPLLTLIYTGSVPICATRIPPSEIGPRRVTVSELLDKYAQTQDKLTSFIIEVEVASVSSSSFDGVKNKKKHSRSEIPCDGNRFSIRTRKWANILKGPRSLFCDGITCYQCSRRYEHVCARHTQKGLDPAAHFDSPTSS